MGATSASSAKAKVAAVLFQYRLWREGKLEEYWQRRAQCKVKGAKFGTNATQVAGKKSADLKKEYGWLGVLNEFEREKEHQFRPLINKRKEMMAEYRRNKGRSALDKAFDALPNRAPNEAEVSWIGSHPRMRRAQEWTLENPGVEPQPIKMTVADITSPSCGPCPSKWAYTSLVTWLKDPKEFQKQLLSKQRDGAIKSGDGSPEASGVVSDNLDSLKRIHQQFMAQKKQAE